MAEMFRVNSIAPLLVVQTFRELLVRSDYPRVVNVSSDSGSITRKETPGNYSYAASKAALNMITRALANELRSDRIVVTAVDPGHLRTDIGGPTAPDDPDDAADELYELIEDLSPGETGEFLARTGEKLAW
ncbi:SDR family NAD(P)-dependent oxidoreductase [Halorussus caseinilyticus]|uniref:SDR family NAD(P)-dependent oxidoreductase n=2 Tax=Halorussus caseinilyticus TaxID=3034025 RepID=A0ABD5WN21_9EURY